MCKITSQERSRWQASGGKGKLIRLRKLLRSFVMSGMNQYSGEWLWELLLAAEFRVRKGKKYLQGGFEESFVASKFVL